MDMRKFQYRYISAELVKNSTTKKIVFLNSGIQKTEKWGDMSVFTVEIDGIQTEFTPNTSSINNLVSAWGADSTKWIGKVADLTIEPKNGKEYVVAKPGTL